MKELESLVKDLAEDLSNLRQLFEIWNKGKFAKITNTWIDGKQVMLALKISQRTLQSLRSKGTLPYSSINNKFYYKISDIQSLLESNYNKKGKSK
nr:helix-turn-helix domain-containing protein [uncultured Marinifilum sp.]